MVSLILLIDYPKVLNLIDYRIVCNSICSILSQYSQERIEIVPIIIAGQTYIPSFLYQVGNLEEPCLIQKDDWVDENNIAKMINKGIEKSKGDIIGYTNLYSILYPEKILVQLSAIKSNEESWSFSGFSTFDNKRIDYFIGEQYFGQFCNLREGVSFSNTIINRFPNSCFINENTVLFTRKMIDKVGLFDERFTILYNYDMWCRMAYVVEPLVMLQPLVMQYNLPVKIDEELKNKEINIIKEKLLGYSLGKFA